MTEILVVAAAPVMEALMVDLVELTGSSPRTPCPAESTSALADHADALLLDASLPVPMRDAWEQAADRAGAAIVYFASTMSEAELVDFARRRGAVHFPLPNGPRHLAAVLAEARAGTPRGEGGSSAEPEAAARPRTDERVILDSVLSVARTRVLQAHAAVAADERRSLQAESPSARAQAAERRAALREAVRLYALLARDRGVSEGHALRLVRDALAEQDGGDSAEQWMTAARAWVAEAYRAA